MMVKQTVFLNGKPDGYIETQPHQESEELTIEQVEAFLADVKQVCNVHGLFLSSTFDGQIAIDKIDKHSFYSPATRIDLVDGDFSVQIIHPEPAAPNLPRNIKVDINFKLD